MKSMLSWRCNGQLPITNNQLLTKSLLRKRLIISTCERCAERQGSSAAPDTPGPRTSSCMRATAKPCSLRGLGRCDARALCTSSLCRLASRHSFAIMAFHGAALRGSRTEATKSWRCNALITNHQLPITNHQLPITNYSPPLIPNASHG
jgi:hypothetical protein